MGAIGILHSKFIKQKLNTTSSTKLELVGVSKYLHHLIWILYFFKEQGFTMKATILNQDDPSTIESLKNGIKMAGKHSRHVSINDISGLRTE